MELNNEKRVSERYNISEYIGKDYYQDIHIEINADKTYIPEIIDISMSGVGFSMKESNKFNSFEEIKNLDICFIKICLPDADILTESKKMWSVVTEENGNRILRGGFAFDVMSSADRLILADFIKRLRNDE